MMISERSSRGWVRLPLPWITAQGSTNRSATLPGLKVQHPFRGMAGKTEHAAASYSTSYWPYQCRVLKSLSVCREKQPASHRALKKTTREHLLSSAVSCQAPCGRWAPNQNQSVGTWFTGRSLMWCLLIFPCFSSCHSLQAVQNQETDLRVWKNIDN